MRTSLRIRSGISCSASNRPDEVDRFGLGEFAHLSRLTARCRPAVTVDTV